MTGSRKRVVLFGSLIICLTLAMGLTALASVRLAHAASFAVTDCSQEGTSSTPGTIAKAIADATADGGTSESIIFNCGTATIPITTPLVVSMSGKTLTINGGGTITLDGGSSSQIMQITSSAEATLENLRFTHGLTHDVTPSSAAQGGALAVTGSDLTLTNDMFAYDVAVTGASSSLYAEGGALYMSGGSLSVQDSTFDHDAVDTTAGYGDALGGAIFYQATGTPLAGTISISGSTFTNDSAKADDAGEGGAVYIYSSAGGSIASSTFDHDSAASTRTTGAFGGAVALAGNLDTVSGDSFTNDTVITPGVGAGGAVALVAQPDHGSIVTVANGSVLSPIKGAASGIPVAGSITTLSGCTFDRDSATSTSGAPFGSADGGALSAGNITTLTTSDFTNNTASGSFASGGAIDLSGITTISRSAFVGNSVNDNNLRSNTQGGAIDIDSDTPLVIANSTFAANAATASSGAVANGGAIYYYAGATSSSLALVNDTLGGDSISTTTGFSSGGEVFVGAAETLNMTMTNSILANGTVNGVDNNCGAAPPPFPSILTDGGNNIDSGASCGFSSANHSLSNINPKLGTPASFFGSTLTYPLLPGSPAIDAGDDSVCDAAPVSGVDQRGEPRPQGAHCDIGAYEFARITTGTTLTASPNTQAQGQPVQICATVTASGTSVNPTGSVTFYDGSTSLGSATLSSGKSCFLTSSLSLGTHNNLTAKYGGDPTFLGSTSAPASVFIGVTGNGGAAPGAQPVNPQGPTGGSVTSTGSGNNDSSSSSGTATSNPTATTTSQNGGLPGWLLVLLALVVLCGGAGSVLYLRRRGLLVRPWSR